MTSISISSQKGGVGKTTLSVNLAYSFAKLGKTLIIDSDPNGSVGHLYQRLDPSLKTISEPGYQPRGLYNMLTDSELSLADCIIETAPNSPSLLFAGTVDAYETLEECPAANFESGLGILLEQVSDLGYQYVIIDTAAGLFKPSRAAIKCSDFGLIVQHPSPISDHTAQQGMRMYDNLIRQSQQLKQISIVLSMVDEADDSAAISKIRLRYNKLSNIQCLDQVITKDPIYQKAAQFGYSVSSMSQSSSVTDQIDALRDEIWRKSI